MQGSKWSTTSAVLLILAGAVLVRLWGLGDPAPWMDELHSLLYARNPVTHLIDINRTTDIHPPLYFLALKGWTALFGDSREAARLLSVVLDGVSLLLLFAIARALFTTRVALIAIVFFATFPTAVHYAREIRMYPLFTALFLASFLCFTHLYLRGRNAQHPASAPASAKGQALWTLGFAVSLALTLYTHYTSALLYVLYSLAGLYVLLRGPHIVSVWIWGGLALATLLVVPQVVHLLSSSLGDPDKAWMEPTTWRLFYSVTLGGYPYPALTKLGVLVVLAIGAWLMARRYPAETVILLLFTAGGMILAAGVGVFEPIYLVRTIQVYTVFSGVFVAFALLALPRWPAIALGAALVVLNLVTVAGRDYPGAREDLLAERIRPLAALLDPARDVAFAIDYTQRQMAVLRVPLFDIAQPISLFALERDIAAVQTAAESCLASGSDFRAVVLVIEADSLFEKQAIAAWNGVADDLKASAPAYREAMMAGFRVLILSRDTTFLSQVSAAF